MPSHVRKEFIYRFHNSNFAAHIGITKTIENFHQAFYFPNFVDFLMDYVRNCPSCLRVKPVKNSSPQQPPLQSLATQQSFPRDVQVDIVSKLPISRGYKFILTLLTFSANTYLLYLCAQRPQKLLLKQFLKFQCSTLTCRPRFCRTWERFLLQNEWRNSENF